MKKNVFLFFNNIVDFFKKEKTVNFEENFFYPRTEPEKIRFKKSLASFKEIKKDSNFDLVKDYYNNEYLNYAYYNNIIIKAKIYFAKEKIFYN